MKWTRIVRASGLIEWQCEHGVGHPDLRSVKKMGDCWGIHGCCSENCCSRNDFPGRIVNTRPLQKKQAKEFVDAIRARTVCVRCGKQPIEWHRKEHEEKQSSRVSSLRAGGSSERRILEEISKCKALCRSCHMKEDGRIDVLLASAPQQKGYKIPPKPCTKCGKIVKPLRKGLCYTCYEHQRIGGRSYKGVAVEMISRARRNNDSK